MDVSLVNHSEKTYEASNSFGLYNTRFAYHAEECLDSAFLFDSVGCSDCFGCVNLRNKKYYIFNKPYSKQEYAEEIKRWDLGSYEILEEAKKKFWNLCRSTPRRCAIIKRSVNSTGHIVTDSKNCHHCFSVFAGAENLKYVYMAGMAFKDSYDAWGAGAKSQLLYEVTGCMGGERVFFTNNTHYCSNTQYSNKCFHSHNIFGCVGIKKKNYCIFNKQYSKEEYASLVKKIVEQAKAVPYVDAKGRVYRYGEFFPIETMPVAYNESIAYERYPLSREQALAAGYPWYDEAPRKYAVTVSAADLPDHIRDVQDGITQQVIGCAHASSCADKCIGAFKITQRELEFYRQQVLALPRLCPNCRHGERERKRAGIKLFSGTCQCVGKCSADGAYQNHTTHVHGESGCGARFETPYVAGGGEIVYCEVCYQNETI